MDVKIRFSVNGTVGSNAVGLRNKLRLKLEGHGFILTDNTSTYAIRGIQEAALAICLQDFWQIVSSATGTASLDSFSMDTW